VDVHVAVFLLQLVPMMLSSGAGEFSVDAPLCMKLAFFCHAVAGPNDVIKWGRRLFEKFKFLLRVDCQH